MSPVFSSWVTGSFDLLKIFWRALVGLRAIVIPSEKTKQNKTKSSIKSSKNVAAFFDVVLAHWWQKNPQNEKVHT